MPRKKTISKFPITLTLQDHTGEASPHLLNLRTSKFNKASKSRAAEVGGSLLNVPNLLQPDAKRIRQAWQEYVENWLDQILRKAGQIRLPAPGRALQRAASRARRHASARFMPRQLRAHLPHLALLIVAVIILTIPLQALTLYRAIHSTQRSVAFNLTQAQAHFDELRSEADRKDFQNLTATAGALLENIRELRKTYERWSWLSFIFPEQIKSAGNLLASGEQILYDLTTITAEFGKSASPRYILLIFQNPRELRATGGFAGSFALLTLRDGKIQISEAPEGGTYAMQGQLPLRFQSPAPLQLINPRFEFQDANWWPDFPTSAQKIAELYEAAGGPTLDAVLALTAHFGEELLRLHGPLNTVEGQLEAANFVDRLQDAIARDRAANPRTPKKFLVNLLPAMQEALRRVAQNQPQELARSFLELTQQKEIQMWSRHEEAQAAITRLGLSGKLAQTSRDYLAVVTANIGGGKTDHLVQETIAQDIKILPQGRVQKIVRITRAHQGQRGDPSTHWRNIAYLRVYAPAGARLTQAQGNHPPPFYAFENVPTHLTPDPAVRETEANLRKDDKSGVEIWQENGKTVFGFWMITDPQEVSEASLSLEMTFPELSRTWPYTLTVERQAGKSAQLSTNIKLDEALRPLTVEGQGRWSAQGLQFSGPLHKTLVFGAILQQL